MSQETIGHNNQIKRRSSYSQDGDAILESLFPSFFFLTYNRYKDRKITKQLRLQPTVTVLYEIIYMRDLLMAPPLHIKQLR